jgi:predicted dinucleotide-binding enzyme
MRVAVLGTGAAGRAIASRLLQFGHTVTMGSRRADGEALAEWVAEAGEDAQGTFAGGAAASSDESLAEQIQAGARAAEMYVALWVRLYGTLDSADFNIAIAR